GLPVDDFDSNKWKEGSSFSAGGGSMAYMNQAPHPNTAKVLLNWFLSRRGQIALQKLGDVDDPANSRRIDIPKDDILPENRTQSGMKYLDLVKPEYGDVHEPAHSQRIDIPKDDILPDTRLHSGMKYFDVVKPEYGDMKPIFDLAK